VPAKAAAEAAIESAPGKVRPDVEWFARHDGDTHELVVSILGKAEGGVMWWGEEELHPVALLEIVLAEAKAQLGDAPKGVPPWPAGSRVRSRADAGDAMHRRKGTVMDWNATPGSVWVRWDEKRNGVAFHMPAPIEELEVIELAKGGEA
jgi:hypothetical protein